MSYHLVDTPNPQYEVHQEFGTSEYMAPPLTPLRKPPSSVETFLPSLESAPATRWTVGWVTPALITVLYCLALLFAFAHFGFYRWLNDQQVDHSIPQSWVSTISVGLVTAFRSCLVASLLGSFTQILWQLLREKPLRISTIDSLFSVGSNPFMLSHVDIILCAPILWLCAALCWCIPIAMIYPPGALIVESRPLDQTYNATVPTFDPTYLGANKTFQGGLIPNALFQFDQFENYQAPTQAVTRLGTRTLLGGSYLTWPSPCGGNCTYAIQFQGPSYKCEDANYVNLTQVVNATLTTELQSSENLWNRWLWLAAEDTEQFRFDVQWRDNAATIVPTDLIGTGNVTQNISCTLYQATYDLNVTYRNNVQSVITGVVPGEEITFASVGSGDDGAITPNLTNPMNTTLTPETGAQYPGVTVLELLLRQNLRALKDALVLPLTGYLGTPDFHTVPRFNTIVDQSSLVTAVLNSGNAIDYNISAARVEELLQNVTLSMLSISPANANTAVVQTSIINFYAFHRPLNLLLPYFITLAVALLFVVMGLLALKSNGVSASNGGFLQILTTTRASETLDRVAVKSSLGGRENVSRELEEMQVLYGELPSKEGSTAVQRFGFGLLSEVRPLTRRTSRT